MRTVGDPHGLPCPFLIGFRFRYGRDHAVICEPDVLITQLNEFTAPEGSGETHQQQGAVAQCAKVLRGAFEHFAESLR